MLSAPTLTRAGFVMALGWRPRRRFLRLMFKPTTDIMQQANSALDDFGSDSGERKGKLPRGFLWIWLGAFERLRIDNHAMATGFIARLLNDGAPRASGSCASSSQQETYAMGAGWKSDPSARLTLWSLLQALYRESRYLNAARRRLGKAPHWVIADDRRTGLISGRWRLRSLLTPFGGEASPAELATALSEDRGLLCFTPNLLALRPEVSPEGLAHLSYLSLFAMPALHPLRFMAGWWRGMSSMPRDRWFDRHAWITAMLASSVAALFSRHAPDGLTMITSNSFVIELIRYMFLCSGQKGAATEVLHGIPSRKLAAYHTAIHVAFSESLRGRLRFVAPVPGLNMTNYPPGSVVDGIAINLKFNDTAGKRDLSLLAKECVARSNRRGREWVIAINGAGNLSAQNFVSTGVFAMEKAIVAHVRQFTQARGLHIHLQYSIHPAHLKSGLAKEIRGHFDGVEVLEDSFITWLESDLCISIFSGAAWDARALGCEVVTGVRAEDGLFSEEVLSGLAYPRGEESIFDVMDRELARLPALARTGPEARIRNLGWLTDSLNDS